MRAVVLDKKINYEILGEGDPILFVHGWGGSIDSLTPLAKLASAQFKSIVLDLPGFGKSDNPDADWGVEKYGEFLCAFLDKFKIKKVNYFGHSFGGGLGLYLAAEHTDRIKTLMLCGSTYRRNTKKPFLVALMRVLVPKMLKPILYRIFFPQSDLSKHPHLEPNFRKIMKQDLAKYSRRIKQKTLILWGGKDTYTPVLFAYELKDTITGSRLITFNDVGHALPLKQPEMVFEQIKSFL